MYKKVVVMGGQMKLLSRSEEIMLLAIWKLKKEAYGVPIRELVSDWTGQEWAFGQVYKPLKSLLGKNFVRQYTTAPTSERGGRSKHIYELTTAGCEALSEIRKVQNNIWTDDSINAFEK